MAGSKKNILIFFYLVAVLGFGISSIFIGRAVADRQREVLPEETEAADETECSRHCRLEYNESYCTEKGQTDPCTVCQGACKLREANSCETEAGIYMCEDCWVPACEPPPPTPTTPPPTPTPTPLPGCWGVCTVDTNCPQNTTPPLVCPGGRCVNPNCPTEQDCTCPPLLCLGLTATPSAQILKKGDDVEFACKGSYGTGSINHVEFRIQVNDGAWQSLGTAPVTQVSGEYQGVKSYKVPDAGNYRVECRACTSTDETACTNWGLAQ